MMKNILALIFITASGLNTTIAIEIEFENPFTIELSIDSVFTEDGKTYYEKPDHSTTWDLP